MCIGCACNFGSQMSLSDFVVLILIRDSTYLTGELLCLADDTRLRIALSARTHFFRLTTGTLKPGDALCFPFGCRRRDLTHCFENSMVLDSDVGSISHIGCRSQLNNVRPLMVKQFYFIL